MPARSCGDADLREGTANRTPDRKLANNKRVMIGNPYRASRNARSQTSVCLTRQDYVAGTVCKSSCATCLCLDSVPSEWIPRIHQS